MLFVFIAILASALLLRFIDWVVAPPRSLLMPAPGLVTLASLNDLANYSTLPTVAPTDTFEAQLYVVGIYTQPNETFPTGTVSLVYVKDGWRAFEIDYLPDRSIEEQRAMLSSYRQEEVKLNETISAAIVARDASPRCIDFDDGLPNKCEISTQFLFPIDGLLVSLSADGAHVTQGELLQLARSLLNTNTTP